MEAGFVSMRSKVERFPRIEAIHSHKSMEKILNINEEDSGSSIPWVMAFTEKLGRKLPALDLRDRKEPVNLLLSHSNAAVGRSVSTSRSRSSS
jgi:hypothetical protein